VFLLLRDEVIVLIKGYKTLLRVADISTSILLLKRVIIGRAYFLILFKEASKGIKTIRLVLVYKVISFFSNY